MEKTIFYYTGNIRVVNPEFTYTRTAKNGFFTLPNDFVGEASRITGKIHRTKNIPILLTRTSRRILGVDFEMSEDREVSTAKVDWEKAVKVSVNPEFWSKLDRPCKDFVLFHELAHTIAPGRMEENREEFFCDSSALNCCIQIGWNPSQLIPVIEIMAGYQQFPDRRYKDFVKLLKSYV